MFENGTARAEDVNQKLAMLILFGVSPMGPKWPAQARGNVLPLFLLPSPPTLLGSPSSEGPEVGAEPSAVSLRMAFSFDPGPGTEEAFHTRPVNEQMNEY